MVEKSILVVGPLTQGFKRSLHLFVGVAVGNPSPGLADGEACQGKTGGGNRGGRARSGRVLGQAGAGVGEAEEILDRIPFNFLQEAAAFFRKVWLAEAVGREEQT